MTVQSDIIVFYYIDFQCVIWLNNNESLFDESSGSFMGSFTEFLFHYATLSKVLLPLYT